SQILQGLAYIHQHGYFHRDMKPENLLINNKLDVIKIADFGVAREIDSKEPYAHYVGTRWYRAPELLLGSKKYGPELDMWSMGAIMAEMFTRRPLFQGENHAAHQAFQRLKEAMVNTPVLALPDFNEEFVVQTDASGEGSYGSVQKPKKHPYHLVHEVGKGGYGTVWKAMKRATLEDVAIKKQYLSYQESLNLREHREVKALIHLGNNPHIVQLKDVYQETQIVILEDMAQELKVLCMVFEYLSYNLCQLLNGTDYFVSVGKIKRLCSQILQGLAYIHQHGYFHRDMKPENLLINNKLDVIKIADFGVAREIDSKEPYAHYVGTRWYRAPELLLGSKKYGPELDMWSMGAIMAEMFTRRPLFQGENHAGMLSKI
ncbi:Pkinase domain-containing protein, partial [Cephalotus follicularis]